MNIQYTPVEISKNDVDEIEVLNRPKFKGFYNRCIKRILGFILAVIFLIILSLAFAIIALLIIRDSGFPVLYKAERGGYKGKSFQIYKFRSMIKNADSFGRGTTALNDIRITRIGKFLRKTKIDEFPQLINILKGEMSFVGPRPELTKYTDRYTEKEKLILEVRPGITDYSSIEYINLDEIVGSENADDMYEQHVLASKNNLRLKYVENISFKTDMKLFCGTVHRVAKKAVKYIISTNKKDEIRWNT